MLSLDLHGRQRQFDTLLLEHLLNPHIELPLHAKGAARSGRHFHPQHDAILAEFLHPLHLDRLDDPWLEFGILGELQADALDQFARRTRYRCRSRQ